MIILLVVLVVAIILFLSKKVIKSNNNEIILNQVSSVKSLLQEKSTTDIRHYPMVVLARDFSPILKKAERNGRKGFSEDFFEMFLRKYFKNNFEIMTDCYLVENNIKYEPDFTIVYTSVNKEVVIDLEIDEPYEGISELNKRKPLHFTDSDYIRNKIFAKNGWNVLRFSEYQIVKHPISCCKFISDFISSIDYSYVASKDLINIPQIEIEKCWTREEAYRWSISSYREEYLNIGSFPFEDLEINNNYDCIYVADNFNVDTQLRKIINIYDYKNLRCIDQTNKSYQLIVVDKNGFKLEKEDAIVLIKKDSTWLDNIYMKNGAFGLYFYINMSSEIKIVWSSKP